MSRKSRVRAPPGPPNHQASAHAPCHFVFIFFVWFFWAQHWVFKNSLLLLLCFPFAELFFLRELRRTPWGLAWTRILSKKVSFTERLWTKEQSRGRERERLQLKTPKIEENYIRRRKELQFIMHMLLSGTVDLFAQRARSAEQRRTRWWLETSSWSKTLVFLHFHKFHRKQVMIVEPSFG